VFSFSWSAIGTAISNTHTTNDMTAAKGVTITVITSNDTLIRADMQHMMPIIVRINATTCNCIALVVDEIAAMI
jgi:hypothetical protein